MTADPKERSSVLQHDRYPRSNQYDPRWVIEHQMGPNPLWLMESLTDALSLSPGLRVLDLGCGKALSSIFLAKEFGFTVWAVDHWIGPGENLQRIRAAGVEDRVFPLQAEAHALGFAEGFFDLILSVDAYHYFGTDDLYLGYISRLLREGGRIGMVSPALTRGAGEEVPEHLLPFWSWEFCSFHSADWWRSHWAKTGRVRVETADAIPDGWRDWLRWIEAAGPHLEEGWMKEAWEKESAMLRADEGRTLGFARVVGRKESEPR